MKKFQTILFIVCGLAAVLAVFIFAGYIPTPGSKTTQKGSGTVVVWGTYNTPEFTGYMADLADGIQDFHIKYVAKDSATYEQDLIQAFADGTGPDIFFVNDQNVLKFSKQILPVPYTTLPKKTFLGTYDFAHSLFLSSNGVLAYPLALDPYVMYYNRTLLANDGIVTVPKYWDEFDALTQTLTKKDALNSFTQSTLPFGRFENNKYAKDIISLLLMQLGNPIIAMDAQGNYVSTLLSFKTTQGASLPLVIGFFTDYASPDKLVYSWNKSLPEARDAFLTEKLVFYIAPASELFKIRDKNPNLSLAVSEVPQARGITAKRTYAHVTGMALSKYSKNQFTATLAMQTIGSPYHAGNIAKVLNLPSIFIADLKANPDPSLAYQDVLNSSALHAVSWRDPNNLATTALFRELSQSILAGGSDAQGSYDRADASMSFLLSKLKPDIVTK